MSKFFAVGIVVLNLHRIILRGHIKSKSVLCSYSSSWNLEIPTNVIIYEREMNDMYPPHPEVEVTRSQMVTKLRQQYEESCLTREGDLCASALSKFCTCYEVLLVHWHKRTTNQIPNFLNLFIHIHQF